VFYGIFALILFSLVLIAAEYQNRCCWLFLLMALGMTLSFLSLSLHLYKFGSYSYSFHLLFGLDYRIFSWVNGLIRLPMSALARLMNTGIVLYLLAVPLFVYDLTHSAGSRFRMIILLIGLAVYNFCFYDPAHAYLIYLYSRRSAHPGLYTAVISALHRINQLWIFVYLFYPVYILYRCQKQNTTRFIKRQIFLLASCLGVLDLLFYGIFFMGPFMMSPRKAIDSGFWIFENIQIIYDRFYPIIPLITVALLVLTLLLLLNYRLGSPIHLFVDRKIYRDLSRMNDMLSDILHSEKNLLFSILILAGQAAREQEKNDGARKTVEKIRDLAELSLKKTSEALDSLREHRYQFRENSLIAVTEDAIRKVNPGAEIKLVWDKSAWDERLTKCRFDYYHMNQALINLLNNAVDAIQAAGRKEGIILIDAVIQFQWIFIIIQDNGTGIKKDALKHLFDPYYSDKTGAHHWGLGLSYAYKVVKSHWGRVRVESKWGEGTSMQIILPLTAASCRKQGAGV
jgi:signal transduction histidine kinase